MQREASSSVSEALEADGARRLRNESFFSAPQLKRDPLGCPKRLGMATTIPCTRCGKRTAYTEADYVALAAKGGPVLPGGVCFPCAWRDPALQPALREYAERKKTETICRARELLVRPLEFIDRFVESLW